MSRLLRRRRRFEERPSRLWIVAVVLIALAVVLSAISALFYLQSRDYHDAKYRAQWVQMWELTGESQTAATLLGEAAGSNPNLDLADRAFSGAYLIDGLGSMIDSAWTIEEMYLNDADKSVPFHKLGQAIRELQNASLVLAFSLWDNVTRGTTYTENGTLNASLVGASGILSELHTILLDAFRVDPNGGTDRSWEASPYSLVDRLDLQRLSSASEDLMAII